MPSRINIEQRKTTFVAYIEDTFSWSEPFDDFEANRVNLFLIGDVCKISSDRARDDSSPTKPRFIVSRDLDSSDRISLSQKLMKLVPDHARSQTKIRIVVPELEAWYLGDPEAIVEAGLISETDGLRIRNHSRFRDLCNLANAKLEFRKFVPKTYGQISVAHEIGPRLRPERNKSANFHAFVDALKWASQTLEHQH